MQKGGVNIGISVLFGKPKTRVLHRKFMRLKSCSWRYTKKTCIVRKPWWWLRNQRQQLKRNTKEWVAANSEVQMFFCWFWETNVRSMLHHHPLKLGGKPLFDKLRICWKLEDSEKKWETCYIITLSSLGGKPFLTNM